jgi:GNAT superfamily N-acetyltransferase
MIEIEPYDANDRAEALEIAIRAWRPVFAQLQRVVPGFVYDNFYPDGWEARQRSELRTVLDQASDKTTVARRNGELAGWISIRIHPADRMGEIYVLCVDPEHERQGVGGALMEHAHQEIRRAGMNMVMVETGDDPGHEAARSAYESAGYQRWPVARYFKAL